MLWEELRESLIFIGLEAQTYEDVMRAVGTKVTEEGFAKESYAQALIDREKDFPTGLDVDGFGVAIPHTDVSHVISAATAIAVLKNPLPYVQMGTDDEYVDVKVVFVLAVDDPKGHMDQLQRIIAVIQDKNVLEEISKATEAKEIIEIIRKKENTL